MNNETKKCKRCGRVLPIEQMYRTAFGVSNVCGESIKADTYYKLVGGEIVEVE